MTTIAWDGKTLAADSRMVGGTAIRSEQCMKLHRIDGAWLAGCGDMQDVLLAVQWYNEGAKRDAKPTIDDSFAALILRDGEVYRVENKLIEWGISAPFAAAGSGVEFALGAMAAGADAIEAVRIAARFDPATNANVTSTDGAELISRTKP